MGNERYACVETSHDLCSINFVPSVVIVSLLIIFAARTVKMKPEAIKRTPHVQYQVFLNYFSLRSVTAKWPTFSKKWITTLRLMLRPWMRWATFYCMKPPQLVEDWQHRTHHTPSHIIMTWCRLLLLSGDPTSTHTKDGKKSENLNGPRKTSSLNIYRCCLYLSTGTSCWSGRHYFYKTHHTSLWSFMLWNLKYN